MSRIIKTTNDGKKSINCNSLPKKLIINNCKIVNESLIAQSFNHAFVNSGVNLASKIKFNKSDFKSYRTANNAIIENNKLTEKELLNAASNLKPNKGLGVDDVCSNVLIKSISNLKFPLMHIFTLSLEQGIFPDKLKLARVVPVFKSGDDTSISNYRPISILPCLSKLLEYIM
ncbi:uncharacterized protein LOC136080128 [Hydra vulgaris]|uniref:Uncharacterized protein LOC136080128 n=1 Tax=Hydra vulgaris TaxID=6087 RepID=A0ABM4BUF7_HYDVU